MYNMRYLIQNMPISAAELARVAGVNAGIIKKAREGETIRRDKAIAVLDALSRVYRDRVGTQDTFTLDNTDIKYS